jgi:hypothetical protein
MELNQTAQKLYQETPGLDPFREWKRSQYVVGQLQKTPNGDYYHNNVPHTSEQLHRYMLHRSTARLG